MMFSITPRRPGPGRAAGRAWGSKTRGLTYEVNGAAHGDKCPFSMSNCRVFGDGEERLSVLGGTNRHKNTSQLLANPLSSTYPVSATLAFIHEAFNINPCANIRPPAGSGRVARGRVEAINRAVPLVKFSAFVRDWAVLTCVLGGRYTSVPGWRGEGSVGRSA